MDTRRSGDGPEPRLTGTHRNFADAVNRNLVRSEVEGGVSLRDLRPGMKLAVETRNRIYRMTFLGGRSVLLSGHPEFCAEPTRVEIEGCTWGGSMLKARYIGRGMHLEFQHPEAGRILTSRIVDVRMVV